MGEGEEGIGSLFRSTKMVLSSVGFSRNVSYSLKIKPKIDLSG